MTLSCRKLLKEYFIPSFTNCVVIRLNFEQSNCRQGKSLFIALRSLITQFYWESCDYLLLPETFLSNPLEVDIFECQPLAGASFRGFNVETFVVISHEQPFVVIDPRIVELAPEGS